MPTGLTVTGFDQFRVTTKHLKKNAPKLTQQVVALQAEILANSWRDWTSGPTSATRVGRRSSLLHGTIAPRRKNKGKRRFAYWVETKATDYPIFQELGTRFLPARPHMAPALRQAQGPMDLLAEGKTDKALLAADRAGRKFRNKKAVQ